jgi:hypothetical protein
MTRTAVELDLIWKFCTRHRHLLSVSESAGCFHCGAIFSPTEISEWIDEPPLPPDSERELGVTAACPRCTMDAVLPSAAVDINTELLAEMGAQYFGGQFRSTTPAPQPNTR